MCATSQTFFQKLINFWHRKNITEKMFLIPKDFWDQRSGLAFPK